MLSKITHTLREQAFFVNEKACIKSDTAYDVSDPNLPVDISRRIEMLCRGETDEKIVLPQYVENKLSLNIFPTGQVDCLTVAYVFNVYCEEETEAVILSHHSKLKGYVWVNNEYIGKAPQGSIMQIKLKTGNNIFCFLLLGIKATPVLAVRLNKVANEEKVNYVSLSTNNSIATLYSENIVRILYDKYTKGIYKGMLFSFDRINCDVTQDVTLDVTDYHTDKVYASYTIKFNTPFEIDLSQIDFGENGEQLIIQVRICYHKNGEKRYLYEYFYTEDPIKGKARFLRECQAVLDDPNILDTARVYLETRKERLLATDEADLISLRGALWGARFALSDMITGRYPRDKYLPGSNKIFFKSKIDNQIYHFDVSLPHDYDELKKYPLVLHCATNKHTCFADRCEISNYRPDAIIANLTMRGVTLGSYIGEASMNEIYDIVKKEFSIDEERVSILGFSNGATATWLQAQLTPHKFAAMAPCTGLFHTDMIKNLANIKVLDLESPADKQYWQNVQNHKDAFASIKGYSLIETEAYKHKLFRYVYVSRDLISELAKHKIEKYPDDIYYRAIHNRHLEAYWISIHSIEDQFECGDVEAHIESNDTITVSCSGITGFTVHTPPQITANQICVCVNGQELIFDRCLGEEISVVKIDGTDTFAFGKPNKEKFKIYHGTGLLDVYLTPMSIVNFAPSVEAVVNATNQFASPKTNTYSPQLEVSYPIYTPDTLDTLSFEERSLIVLDHNSANKFACELKALCEIQMDESGFSYQGKRYEGDYCIMQILKHPNNPSCSILYINANNAGLYHKNFFTRSVTIPMYSKTKHPYLNNAALVYYNNKYYSIFEYGCELRQINN